MAKGYVGVPTSYTQLEYIESTGTQYIDTGFKAKDTTKVEIKVSAFPPNSTWACAFGARTAGGTEDEYSFFRTDTGLYRSDFAGNRVTFPSGTNLINETVVVKDGIYTTINDTTVINTSATLTGIYNLELFACNQAGTAVNLASLKLHYCKIWDNGTLVRNFIPIKDIYNVACLYDLVEGKLYYNQGTGDFIPGSTTGQPVNVGLRARRIKNAYVGVKSSYTPVEYIESSGTQYIDTGILPYQTELEIQFQYISLIGTTYLSGSYNDNDNRYGLIANRSANSDICYGDRFNSYTTLGTADTSTHTVIYNNSSNQVLYDGVVKGTISDLSTTATRSLTLFAYNTSSGPSNNSSVRLFYCKIKDKTNNELVRDFIPVVDNNGVACLWDKIEQKAYYNKGTGTFIAGNATGESNIVVEKARKIVAGWVGEQGVARTIFTSFKKSIWESFLELCQNNTGKSAASRVLQYKTLIENTMANNGKDVNKYHTIHVYMNTRSYTTYITFVVPTTYWYAFDYRVSGTSFDFYISGQAGSQRIAIDSGGRATYYGSMSAVDYYDGVIGVFSKVQTSGTPASSRCAVEVIPS